MLLPTNITCCVYRTLPAVCAVRYLLCVPYVTSLLGPAGTGKTESVKALGHQLGRFVLVFNCDETFDFQAMGRIFVGLCQVG